MDYKDKPKSGYYDNIRVEMLSYLPATAKKVIDIGCGKGSFAKAIKEKNNAEVWGIELMEDEGRIASEVLDKVFIGECEKFLDELPDNYFDAIFFNDVLEHLYDPYMVLRKMKNKLTSNGVVISSIPNIRYHSAIKMIMLQKDFRYQDFGTMDFTHIRWFTKKSILRMYDESGYKVINHEGINKTSSLKPYLYNIPLLFTQMDMRDLQYATVAVKK